MNQFAQETLQWLHNNRSTATAEQFNKERQNLQRLYDGVALGQFGTRGGEKLRDTCLMYKRILSEQLGSPDACNLEDVIADMKRHVKMTQIWLDNNFTAEKDAFESKRLRLVDKFQRAQAAIRLRKLCLTMQKSLRKEKWNNSEDKDEAEKALKKTQEWLDMNKNAEKDEIHNQRYGLEVAFKKRKLE